MQRPNQHIIKTRSEAIFKYYLPSVHVIRDQQQDDYGIDFEIELFHYDESKKQGHSTGFLIKVQLKGTEKAERSSDGNRVSFGYSLRKASYLIEQIKVPAVIVLVDISDEAVYWIDVQGNKTLVDAYNQAVESGQDTFTIHFDSSCRLPMTWNLLVTAMDKTASIITLRQASEVKLADYQQYVDGLENIEIELVRLDQEVDIANSTLLHRFVESDQLDEAEKLIEKILRSEERSVEAKFDALLITEQVFIRRFGNQLQGFDKANFDLYQAEELKALSNLKGASADLKLLAEGYEKTAILHYLAVQDFQLYVNWVTQKTAYENDAESVELFWFATLPVERQNGAKRLLEAIKEVTVYASKLIEAKQWQYLPEFLSKTLWSAIIFLQRLKAEGLEEATSETEQWIQGLIEFLVKLSPHLASHKQAEVILYRCVVNEFQLISIFKKDDNKLPLRIERAKQIIDLVDSPSEKIDWNNQLIRVIAEVETDNEKLGEVDWDKVTSHYRQQAQALGIDLRLADLEVSRDDERYTDVQIARIIRVGIEDVNPTRILRNCSHLIYNFWGGRGIPAEMLQLPSAGQKMMSCVLHPEHPPITSLSLDSLYTQFHARYCAHCRDASPQTNDWKYSSTWHEQRLADLEVARQKLKSQKPNTSTE